MVQFPDGAGTIVTQQVGGPLTPCPSAGTSYWGDYDDIQLTGFSTPDGGTPTPTWIQTSSDSSQGCQFQWQYISYHVHVSNVQFQ